MDTSIKISSDLKRAIMLRSAHNRHTKRSKATQHIKRQEAQYGSKSYRDALQRAFNTAKEQIFFNPDMTNFITFTYKGKDHTHEDVMNDIKLYMKKERRIAQKPIKYIYVMEYQKRGSIHVHMIANDSLLLRRNKNAHLELTNWTHGYTSVLRIKDLDNNFRPYLYLFKYMKKAQRIGKSFLHSSKNLNNYTTLKDAEIQLLHWRTINMEYTETTIETTNFSFYRNYLEFDDTIAPQLYNFGGHSECHEQVKLHSTKELARLVKNHSKP